VTDSSLRRKKGTQLETREPGSRNTCGTLDGLPVLEPIDSVFFPYERNMKKPARCGKKKPAKVLREEAFSRSQFMVCTKTHFSIFWWACSSESASTDEPRITDSLKKLVKSKGVSKPTLIRAQLFLSYLVEHMTSTRAEMPRHYLGGIKKYQRRHAMRRRLRGE
jgi:hypothetical protein